VRVPDLPYVDQRPRLGADVQLADDAVVVGAVEIAGPARLGARAVVRGDQSPVTIGARFYLGSGSTVHVESFTGTRIGSGVWVGDHAVVHGTTVGDRVRVEAGALVLTGSTVGSGSVIAGGSLVPENATFPENSYVEGTPARRLRDTTPEERAETEARLASALS
jgi:carbonic anhydrase/acetyltransferase-like protein (isoleucine patch superfamily)